MGTSMKANEAIAQMVAPSMRRDCYEHGGILQIWVTRACDKACFGLYVAHRADFYDDAAIDAGKPSANYPPIAAGFFHLHRSNRLYADWSLSAQQCDLDFAASFPVVRMLPLTCCHLGKDGQNWEGRVTPAWNPRPLKVMK